MTSKFYGDYNQFDCNVTIPSQSALTIRYSSALLMIKYLDFGVEALL